MSSDNFGIGKWVAGITATVVSGVAVYYLTEAKPKPAPRPDPTPTISPDSSSSLPVEPPAAQSVEFTILNELGPGQVSEEVQVYINGQTVATLTVNQQQVTDSAKVELPEAGSYSYTLLADGIFFNQIGQTYRQQARGDGNVEVDEGGVFSLMITPHGVRMVSR